MVFQEVSLKGHSTPVGAVQWDVLALDHMIDHLLVGGSEGAVLADMRSFGALSTHVVVHHVLGDSLLAVEGTGDVHILAVVLVRVQVSVQLLQWP